MRRCDAHLSENPITICPREATIKQSASDGTDSLTVHVCDEHAGFFASYDAHLTVEPIA